MEMYTFILKVLQLEDAHIYVSDNTKSYLLIFNLLTKKCEISQTLVLSQTTHVNFLLTRQNMKKFANLRFKTIQQSSF